MPQEDEGEVGDRAGSVLRRGLRGFLGSSKSEGVKLGGLWMRDDTGTGEDLNSSIRSVSGTGSIVDGCRRHEPAAAGVVRPRRLVA
jgi:hypothetical protein